MISGHDATGREAVAWTKTSCPTPDISIWYAPSGAVYEQCDRWRQERLAALLEDPPDLVILGNSSRYYTWVYDAAVNGPAGAALRDRLWQDGFEKTANQLLASGIRVVDLRDTPQMYANYKDCLSAGDWTDCHRPRDQALAGLANPSNENPLFQRLDLSDALCDAHRCWAGLEEAILYRDNHHLTARYAASLHDRFETVLTVASAKP